jgi:hypothetical protein
MKADTLAGLMPLEPPPALAADPTAWIALGLLLALLLVGLWFSRSRPARRRLRRLDRIAGQLAEPGSDSKALAAEAERLLQSFAPRGPLQAARPPASVYADHWQALVDALHAARFGTRPVAGAPLAELLDRVLLQLVNSRVRA